MRLLAQCRGRANRGQGRPAGPVPWSAQALQPRLPCLLGADAEVKGSLLGVDTWNQVLISPRQWARVLCPGAALLKAHANTHALYTRGSVGSSRHRALSPYIVGKRCQEAQPAGHKKGGKVVKQHPVGCPTYQEGALPAWGGALAPSCPAGLCVRVCSGRVCVRVQRSTGPVSVHCEGLQGVMWTIPSVTLVGWGLQPGGLYFAHSHSWGRAGRNCFPSHTALLSQTPQHQSPQPCHVH